MNISIEEMQSCIQEWFSQAFIYDELFKIYYAILSEANKQVVYIAKKISEESDVNGLMD